MRVFIDGLPVPDAEAVISVFDWAVQRGYGCFEVIRAYDGTPFRADAHLERLERSAAALALRPPNRPSLAAAVHQAAAAGGDCQVRVILTAGGRDLLAEAPPRTVVMWEPLPHVPVPMRLQSMAAPWHPGRSGHPLTAVKWLSYAPNMASSDAARRAGYDDALLISDDGWVIEGPTFGVAWLVEGRLETPGLELGILPSITRAAAIEAASTLGIPVEEGAFPLGRVLEAGEVLALSTTRQVTPIGEIDGREMQQGPVGAALLDAFLDVVAAEIGHDPRHRT
jgi:branched-chain amino acid aminotransferase